MFNKGRRQLKEYNWLKRLLAYGLSMLIVYGVSTQYPVILWHWALFLAHALGILLWYGSSVRIESIVIGIRYALFFFTLSLAVQLKTNPFSTWMIVLSLSYVVLCLVGSWSLPRVKLGLQIIKPVGAWKISTALIVIVYNLVSYFLVSNDWLMNLIQTIPILIGFLFLYSIYSKKNVIHFIIITYLVHWILLEYLLGKQLIWIQPLIVVVIYIVFIIIQFNTKPTIKKEKRR